MKDVNQIDTVRPPPMTDVSPESLRRFGRELRFYASRWLQRAAELEAVAEKMDGTEVKS